MATTSSTRPTPVGRGRARATRLAAGPVDAYVLHRYDWSESSLILDLFTREQGRLAVAAKGAKRPYSQWRAVLLPFQRIQVGLARAKGAAEGAVVSEGGGDIQNLRSAEWAGGPPMPTGAALFSGFHLNELLLRLLARHDPHPRIFDAYADALVPLAGDDEAEAEAALRAFELTLLRDTGLLPDLSVVTPTQRAVEPGRRYGLQPESGVVADGDPAATASGFGPSPLDGATLIGLEAALQHGSLAALRAASHVELAALKRPLRALIQHQLGSVPLRTRRVVAGLQGY